MIDRSRHPELADLLERITSRFGSAVRGVTFEKDELTVMVATDDLLAMISWLKSENGFNALNDIIALDNLNDPAAGGLRFSVLYQLYRFPRPLRVRVRIDLPEGAAVPSIYSLYRSADWAEREMYDMFGITVQGHPDLRRIYLPDDFDGYPLRKDFPLAGREQ